jgi:hypothetical protein
MTAQAPVLRLQRERFRLPAGLAAEPRKQLLLLIGDMVEDREAQQREAGAVVRPVSRSRGTLDFRELRLELRVVLIEGFVEAGHGGNIASPPHAGLDMGQAKRPCR